MRVRPWSRLLVPLVVLIAGCLPSLAVDPPASFLERVQSTGSSFAAAAPPSGAMTMDEAIKMVRGQLGGDADLGPNTLVHAMYGTVTCPDLETCSGAFDAHGLASAFPVWVVWSLATTGPDGGVWVAVNANTHHRAFRGP